MKESRFIELLNLYVDHQLSADEVPELEAEIANNSARRNTYQQYCRIQKACTVLFEQERTQAPTSATLAASLRDADRKIVAFPDQRFRRRSYYPVGLLTAAACVAFVVVRFSLPQEGTARPSGGLSIVSQESSETVQSVVLPLETPAATIPNERASFYSVFATPRGEREVADVTNDRFTSNDSLTPTVSYAWMRQVNLEPVQTLSPSSLTLQTTALGSSEVRVLRSRKPVEGATEMTAFTFQR